MSGLRIATRWFERKKVDADITLLWEPHVHPFLRCNIWHVRGRDSDLLIDTGLGVASLADAAKDLFEKPLIVVLTHTHMDHCGGAHEFTNLCVHCNEAKALEAASHQLPLDIAAWEPEVVAWIAGMGYDISGGLVWAIPNERMNLSEHALRVATPARLLQHGDEVTTGDRAFSVLHLPGHSPGSIGLWEKNTGTLFSGDAIYDGPLLDQIPGADIADYITSMELLRSLPVTTVHAGHEASFGRQRLIEIADSYLSAWRAK